MLYFWIIYCLALLAYSVKTVSPYVVSQGMIYMSEHQRTPSLWYLFTLLVRYTAKALPRILLLPIPLICTLLGLGASVYFGFQ